MSTNTFTDPASQEKLRKLHFEDGPRMLVAGLRQTYDPQTTAEIPQLWRRFAPRMASVPGRLGVDAWGICFNGCEAGHGFDYLCGVAVTEKHRVKGDWDCVELPSQRYAALTHRDHVSSLRDTIDLILRGWLPQSHYLPASDDPKAPSFLERYTPRFDPATGEGGVEIWVPIRPRESRYSPRKLA